MIQLKLVSLMAEHMDFFYRQLAEWLSSGGQASVQVQDGIPWQRRERLLDRGDADIGFVCGLHYVRKVDGRDPLVELLAAPVMSGARYGGEPVYFSDVIVRSDSDVTCFDELRGRSWAFNERSSHSGYTLPRYELARRGKHEGFFARVVESGAHQKSLQLVIEGTVDSAAIDSIVLETEFDRHPHLVSEVRVIETFGPSPAPPAVASTKLPSELRVHVRERLLSMHCDHAGRELLARAGIDQFVPVCDADYDPIRRMDRAASRLSLGPESLCSLPVQAGTVRRSFGTCVGEDLRMVQAG